MAAECQIPGCTKTEAEHLMTAHQFQPTEALLEARRGLPRQPPVASDAVLRMLLVRKGIITNVELKGMEEELRTAGLLGGPVAGNRSDGRGSRKVRNNPQA